MILNLNKLELIEKLQIIKGGELSIKEEQIGFSPKGSSLFYWFKTTYNGNMQCDYIWSQSSGKKSYQFVRFFNFVTKNNLK